MPRVGAHVSAATSLSESLTRATHIGAECTQIFISPPRQWNQTNHAQQEIEDYVKVVRQLKVEPNFIHGTYLMNLGTDSPEHLKKSIDWLKYGLEMAERLKVKGVIFHTGSHKGRGFKSVKDQIISALREVLKSVNGSSWLILENCAGSGGVIGSFEELGEIIKGVGNPRAKVCLDTQHAFAAGYDFRSQHGLENLISTIETHIGWENLAAIHCNDSKTELGSNRDRHENIGEGFIGKEAFKLMLNHPKFSKIPFILEVPGYSGNGPDKDNIDTLKSLINS